MSDIVDIHGKQVPIGVGHPDPNHPSNKDGQEAKLLDYEGRPIVSMKPWGDAKTNLYITIIVSKLYPIYHHRAISDKPPCIHNWPQGNCWITIATSEGKPIWGVPCWGASLELPDDLGNDELKRRYVFEWMRDTLKEALVEAVAEKAFTGFTNHRVVGQWLFETANKAINEIGL